VLKNKKILLGVTGGISAYKICSVVRLLKKAGAHVRVLMTQSATQFVTPLTFSTLSQEEVITSLWPESKSSSTRSGVEHVNLALWGDVMVVAPATANTIAKIVHGIADDIVASTVLALRCPLLVVPAMDVDMYLNDATRENLAVLRERGHHVLPPAEGELASGLSGPGRLPEPEAIVAFIEAIISKTSLDLRGRKILVSAGPTYEPIDPVRFIGNRSSGKMGFAIANAAAQRGADVTLVSGPVSLGTPKHVTRIDVETAEQMHRAVLRSMKNVDAVIMSAAVADFTPVTTEENKIKKGESGTGLTLRLQPTADILRELGGKKKGTVLVGFALETADELKNAKEKLKKKNLDLVVLNSTRDEGAAFGSDTNVVTLIGRDGRAEKLPKMPKFDVAVEILNRVAELL